MSKEKYGVHISHCCYIHGCKYGDKDCPVVSGEVAQKHLCYDCTEEYEPYTLEEIELLRKTKSYRPNYEQLKNRVADLEAKLAEQQECNLKASAKHSLEMQNTQICVKELEAKLAESEKSNEYFADRVEKADKEIKENYRNYNKLVEEYNELKQQLAEKDAEIEKWKSMAERSSSMLDRFNYCGESIVYNTTREQDKISFALEQLEKVKELCRKDMTICEDYFAIAKILDNQIKAIKEMMKSE